MTKKEMVKGLRYKAANIKAHMEPEFFAEIADYLLEEQKAEPKNKIAKERYEDLDIDEEIKKFENNAEFERTHENLRGCQEFKKLVGWLRELKAYKEKEPCEDAISRYDAMCMILHYGNEIRHEVMDDIKASMIRLPSVTPEQKTGKILTLRNRHRPKWFRAKFVKTRYCSLCKWHLGYNADILTHYCPNCGAKMEYTE